MDQRTRIISGLALVAVVIVAAAVVVFWPQRVRQGRAVDPTPPDHMTLTGAVRDFRSDHPDFDVSPGEGPGHSFGNIEPQLSALRPVFGGGGRLVAEQWRDAGGNPIPPHLYQSDDGTGGIAVSGTIELSNTSVIDAPAGRTAVVSTNGTSAGIVTLSNSAMIYGTVLVGPGADPATAIAVPDGSHIDTTGTLPEAVPMPTITVPDDLGPSVGSLQFDTNTTLSADLHVDTLSFMNNAIITIENPIRIVCEVSFVMQGGNTEVRLAPGATLDLYVRGILPGTGAPDEIDLNNGGLINTNTGDPGRVRIHYLGTRDIGTDNSVEVCADIVAPNARLRMGNTVHVRGSFRGQSLEMNNPGHFTVTGALPSCMSAADTPGVPSAESEGAISGPDSFVQWFRDHPGVNVSMLYAIDLVLDADGVYEYTSNAFHPIDDVLFGNEGQAHNHYLTYEIIAAFTYAECSGQFLEVGGGDGAWVFIDGGLAIDLGGVAPATTQRVDLDRMGLTDGSEYHLRLFHSQRTAGTTTFHLRTNVMLSTDGLVPAVSVQYD